MRIPLKVVEKTGELYRIQMRISKLRAELKILQEEEDAIQSKLEPVYSTNETGETEVIINGTSYMVKFRHVDREIVNTQAIERFYHRMGKKVPMKDSGYNVLKVVKA